MRSSFDSNHNLFSEPSPQKHDGVISMPSEWLGIGELPYYPEKLKAVHQHDGLGWTKLLADVIKYKDTLDFSGHRVMPDKSREKWIFVTLGQKQSEELENVLLGVQKMISNASEQHLGVAKKREAAFREASPGGANPQDAIFHSAELRCLGQADRKQCLADRDVFFDAVLSSVSQMARSAAIPKREEENLAHDCHQLKLSR
jgi:hypothetical protein